MKQTELPQTMRRSRRRQRHHALPIINGRCPEIHRRFILRPRRRHLR